MLEIDRLSAEPFVREVSFKVRSGEIVCLAGLVGSGRSEACEAIFGARARSGGGVRLRGAPVRFRDPSEAIAAGVGMAPEDRKDAGLFLTMDVASNISVSVMDQVSEAGRISAAKSEALARRFVEELHIATPSVRTQLESLSGGNQQKVMLAKWLALDPLLLIVDEPTRGVDVGARAEIYRILRGLAAKGVALLVVSSDLPEVLALADRIVVMADGRSVGELDGETADEEAVLRLATLRAEVSAAESSPGACSMNKTAPFPTAPREGATTNVRAAGPSLPGRILLALANSRELMLLALIAILVVGMTVVYPNNFPDLVQHFRGAAQCGAERHPRRRDDAAHDRGFVRSLGGLDARARRRLGRRRGRLVGLARARSALWRLCLSAESRVPSTAPSSRGSALTR